MYWCTGRIEQEISANVFAFDPGNVYDRLCQLTDVRKARRKLYRLEPVLSFLVLVKLYGCDRPVEIADWARNHQEHLVKLMQLKRPSMLHYNTYRWILAQVVYQEEIGRLVGEYNQRGGHGEVKALDGNAMRFTPRKPRRLRLWAGAATTFFQSKKIRPAYTKTFSNSLRLNIRSPVLGRSRPISSVHKKSTKTTAASKLEPSPPVKCSTPI